jgi:hypothetical protein
VIKAKPHKRAKSGRTKQYKKPIRARLRLGALKPEDVAFFEDYGSGGMKLAVSKGSVKTAAAGYSKIKRYKLQRKKAQKFLADTTALMNRYSRLRRSWIVVE